MEAEEAHEPDPGRTWEGLVAELRASRAEIAALRRSDALLRAVVEGIDHPVYAKDERGRYLLVNGAAARVLGRTADEILGRVDAEMFPSDTAGRIAEASRRVMAEGRAQTLLEEITTPARVTRTYLTTKAPHRDDRGRVIGIVGISQDISDRVRAEAELARQKEILQTIFDHIPVLINFLGPDGRVLLVNREWERVLGWSREDAQARDMVAELYPDPECRREVLDFIRNSRGDWREFRTRVRDGRILDTAWAVVRLSDGTSIGIGLDITQRKQAEEALRASERQFRAVFEGALDAMILADDEGRYVDANPAACTLFGLSRAEIIGRQVADFAEPGFESGKAWAEFRRSGSSRGFFRLVRPDGTARETEYAATADILPGRHLSVLRDVTERKRAEEDLRASEERLRLAADLVGLSNYEWDLSTTWVPVWNARVRRMWGLPPDAPVDGETVMAAIHPNDRPSVEAAFARALDQAGDGGYAAEYRVIGIGDRVERWVSARGRTIFADGRPVRLVGAVTEITERKRAEEALRGSERRVVAILESITDGFYTVDREWRFNYINPQAERILGRSRAELLGLNVWEEFPEALGTAFDHEFHRVATERVPVAFEVHYPPLGGWYSVHAYPSADGLSVFFSDVTERRRTDERLREAAERLQDLSRRLIRAQEEERRHIAHELHDEIGQALTAMRLNVRVALRDPGSPSATRRLEETIALAERTIGQVRDLSLDLRPSMLDDLGLLDALRSDVAGFGQRSGTEARFVADEAIGRLDPDVETACYRIAQEALTNVARHAGAGRVRVELGRSEAELRLVVADDGAGFDLAAATARASSGFSLGVLGMRERATLVGGRVEIESRPGRGTEVRATFPPGGARPATGEAPSGE